MHNNNFYKVNHLYNAQHPWLSVPSQHGSTTTARIHTHFPKIAATIAKFRNRQQTNSNEPSVASSSPSSSYWEKINQILTNWQQLQKQKKAYQEQQQNEFDQIMEEVLEHQLKELESEEEKQSNLIQQVIEEQLEHEYHEKKSTKDDKEDHLEQLQQFEELETILEDEQKNQLLKTTDFEEFKRSQQNQRSNKVD